jgi:hypothetical protein
MGIGNSDLENGAVQTDLNLEYKVDHVEFLSTDFTITSTITFTPLQRE